MECIVCGSTVKNGDLICNTCGSPIVYGSRDREMNNYVNRNNQMNNMQPMINQTNVRHEFVCPHCGGVVPDNQIHQFIRCSNQPVNNFQSNPNISNMNKMYNPNINGGN